MDIFTLGSGKKSYDQFKNLINRYRIPILLDIRLHNDSQLLGFTRKRDLPSILRDVCSCKYEHCINYAPTEEILTDWRNERIIWPEYEARYRALMSERKAVKDFINCYGRYASVCLLCAEPKPTHCHRRLFAEMIAENLSDTEIIHL
ncbi:MAG: DUF488 domain-containing protein [Synergistaceae bacterium]|nr:DUF488 domain-containing protein [Synergistaceae bacterium]